MTGRRTDADRALAQLRGLGADLDRLARHLDHTGNHVAVTAVRDIGDRLDRFESIIGRIVGHQMSGPAPGPATTVALTWATSTTTNERIIIMSDINIPDDSSGDTCTLTFTDKEGNPTAGGTSVPTWSASDAGSLITLTVAADGLSATAVPVPDVPLGSSTVTITGLTSAAGTALPDLTTTVTTVGGEASVVTAAWSPVTATATAGDTVTAAPSDTAPTPGLQPAFPDDTSGAATTDPSADPPAAAPAAA